MTDHKFTDEEIVKMLECCDGTLAGCIECPNYNNRYRCRIERDAIDLINRQKAEIERLRDECENQSVLWRKHFESIFETAKETIKAEAIKEFAERLQKKLYPYNGVDKKQYAINARAVEKAIEDLVKEMTEAEL